MREVKPALDRDGVRLVAVGIGYPEVGREFCELTGFDPTLLYADPENVLYKALSLDKSVASLAFSPQTPFALANRLAQGRFDDLAEALKRFSFPTPPSHSGRPHESYLGTKSLPRGLLCEASAGRGWTMTRNSDPRRLPSLNLTTCDP